MQLRVEFLPPFLSLSASSTQGKHNLYHFASLRGKDRNWSCIISRRVALVTNQTIARSVEPASSKWIETTTLPPPPCRPVGISDELERRAIKERRLTQIVGGGCPMKPKKQQRYRQHDHDHWLPGRCTDHRYTTIISQTWHRWTSHWYSDTPAPLRWPIPRSGHLRSHSRTTSHSPQSRPTRIDHAGWTASIKLAGTLYDAP